MSQVNRMGARAVLLAGLAQAKKPTSGFGPQPTAIVRSGAGALSSPPRWLSRAHRS